MGESLVAAIRYHSTHIWDDRTEAAWKRVYAVRRRGHDRRRPLLARRGRARWWEATVVSHRLHGGHTAVIRAAPSAHYPWLPGQYATIEHPDLPGVWRPYSLAGRPDRGRCARIPCRPGRRRPAEQCAVRPHEPGHTLRLGAASGSALTPPPGTPAVTLIAAGTGWAPVKSVLDELLARRPAPRIRIDVVARGEADFYDGGSLVDLLRAHPCLSAYWWYEERDEGRTRAAERLHSNLSARRGWPGETVYLCGPVMFVQETAELLHESGLPPESLIRDPLPASVQRRGHVSHAEQFLDPRPVTWIDPEARTRPLGLPAPQHREAPRPEPGPDDGGWFEPTGSPSSAGYSAAPR